MKIKSTLIAATLLLSVTSVQAELVRTDWKNTGDEFATLDTETGFEWLDLTRTKGLSINQVESMLSGSFNGWRLPTGEEVTQLMVNAFPDQASQVRGEASLSVPFIVANDFQSNFGTTVSNSGWQYAFGMFKGGPNLSYVFRSGAGANTGSNEGFVFSNQYLTNNLGFSSSGYGVFLVSDGGTTLSSQLDPSINAPGGDISTSSSDVSSPTLMGGMLALFGLAALRRKKRII